jgi:hypothetical protein
MNHSRTPKGREIQQAISVYRRVPYKVFSGFHGNGHFCIFLDPIFKTTGTNSKESQKSDCPSLSAQ